MKYNTSKKRTPKEQTSPNIAILLCTYNGQRYLANQLDSFDKQTHTNWEVWASDDGSKDETHAILEAYQKKWDKERCFIHLGPQKGFAANFLSLTKKTVSSEASYYAYSDQDDIWETDKLSRALTFLDTIPEHIPSLYCSRTQYIDENGHKIGFSNLLSKPPSFQNALVQCIAGGNTMVFNKAARDLIIRVSHQNNIASHDWWTYLLITGCGGRVFYDSYPSVKYRQHGTNLAGQNVTLWAHIARIKGLLAGQFKAWNESNVQALNPVRHELTDEHRTTLDSFSAARKKKLIPRLVSIYHSGVYRQTTLGNLGLVVATLFNRI